MPSYNRTILAGHLTRDPETRSVGSTSVTSFSIAVNEKYKTAAGEQREDVAFIDCEAWGKQGDVIQQYFSKGKAILVEGKLKQDTWQDKETGANRSKLKVRLDNFTFIDSGGEQGGRSQGSQGRGTSRNQSSGYENYNEPVNADDIPF